MARAAKICAKHGCPATTHSRYCAKHQAAHDKARGTATQRGYGKEFYAIRREYSEQHKTQPLTCWRCGKHIPIGETFNLGHDDWDRTIIRGPEHEHCNLNAAGLASHGLPAPQPPGGGAQGSPPP